MTIHYGVDDLEGLGHRVVRAANDAAATYRGEGFADDVPQHTKKLDATTFVTTVDSGFLDDAFSDIPGLFGSFAGPDPNVCAQAVSEEAEVMRALRGSVDVWAVGKHHHLVAPPDPFTPSPAIKDKLDDVQSAMTGWLGQGAVAFDDYVLHCRDTITRQYDAAAVLAIGMRAYHDIMTGAYKSIWRIGEDTIKVLDAGGSGGCGGTAAQIDLDVVSGLLWMAAVPTGGAGAMVDATAFTAFAAAINDAPSFLPASEGKTTVQGTTVLSVIDSMRSAIDKLIHDTAHQQHALHARLSAADTAMKHERKNNELAAKPPTETTSLTNARSKTIEDNFYYA